MNFHLKNYEISWRRGCTDISCSTTELHAVIYTPGARGLIVLPQHVNTEMYGLGREG